MVKSNKYDLPLLVFLLFFGVKSGGGAVSTHRRRKKTEEKANVVDAARGAESMNFFAALAIFHQVQE